MGIQWKEWHFIFLGSKITADGDCSHEIKRHLLLGRRAMIKPRQHFKKQRYYFANKGRSSQGYGFSSGHVWMWELDCKEGWEPKKWCFELWCWRRLLRVPWTARRSNQSILKEISPEYSLKGLMPSNHLILCRPLLLPSIFPSIRVFSNESVFPIRCPKY